MINTDIGGGRAALYLQRVNLEIIKAAARRRQQHGAGEGARAPLGLGHRPVTLGAIKDAKGGRVTPLGYKTARRALPSILARLPDADPRRRVADALASAFERVGAIGGGDLQGGDTKAGVSDGGVTTKIKHAARLRVIEAAVNGWGTDPLLGGIKRGPDRVVMAVQRKRGDRQDIKVFPLLVALCVEGLDLAAILRRHGWSTGSKHTIPLGQAALSILDDAATSLGM